jgi:hypothetical protein
MRAVFPILHYSQIGFGAQKASYAVATGTVFPGLEAHQLVYGWICNPFPHVFISECLIKHRITLSFTDLH